MTTPTLHQLPIDSLHIAANVRKDTRVDKAFVTNLKQHGVLVPIIVTLNDETNEYEVVDGQRRTLAARDAGLTEIPAIVVEKHATDSSRIIEQLVVNDQRAELRPSERVNAYQELALIGLGVDQIARRTNTPKKRVETALTLTNSNAALAALDTSSAISFDHAAIITEFDNDQADVDRLIQVATEQPAQFEHMAQKIRNERILETSRLEVVAEIEAAGITLIDEPRWDTKDVKRIRELWRTNDNGNRVTLDLETALAEAGDDIRAYAGRNYNAETYELGYAVVNWTAHGWSPSSTVKAPLTDDEREARRKNREDKADWIAATTVRHEYLRTLLDFHLPKRTVDPIPLAAEHVLGNLPSGTNATRDRIAHELLSLTMERTSWGHDVSVLPTQLAEKPHTAPTVLLAAILGDVEASISNVKDYHPWRSNDRGVVKYFTWLAAGGYTLAPVEQAILDRAAASTK